MIDDFEIENCRSGAAENRQSAIPNQQFGH
jgi:hypothetical protein